MLLQRDFYARDTLTVARALLGQRLVREINGRRLAGRIVEVEAYVGEDDHACHAHCGPTQRNAPMYGPPGRSYVYLIYGMYHCLNTVTQEEGFPAAVLIRALEPLEGVEAMRERRGGRPDRQLTSGPGRLCQALDIDRQLNGVDLCTRSACLYIERDVEIEAAAIAETPRVGVRGDELAVAVPWRFSVSGSPFVSR